MQSNRFEILLRLTAITCILTLTTLASFRFLKVNTTTAGFIYLLVVLFTAARWGLLESTYASIVSVLLFNFFFLPPIGTLTIADPQNWIALLAFLATSVTASQLSDTVRRQALQATGRQREMEQLYSLSRAILLLDPATSVAQQLAAQISRVFEAPAVVLYEKESGAFHRAGPDDIPGVEELLRDAASRGTQIRETQRPAIVTAIRLGAEPIGSLALNVASLSDSALNGLANLAAIGIERSRAYEQANRAEAARQSDELKSTLLDAIAHEFKTPLTSIKAASTTLLSDYAVAPEQADDLLTVIDEEADRLSSLVTEAIHMSRLEAGRIRLQAKPSHARDIAMSAADLVRRAAAGRPFELNIEPDLPVIDVDRELLQLALRQVLDNALKYSPSGSPIRVGARCNGSHVLFSVEDKGIGIPEADRSKVFERFYRSSATRHNLTGAGLGLAIAKDIVQAHGGDIWVEAAPGGGSVFHISIPMKKRTQI
jgi:two-component system, OmpR family, sensor histidine kinase KdpD